MRVVHDTMLPRVFLLRSCEGLEKHGCFIPNGLCQLSSFEVNNVELQCHTHAVDRGASLFPDESSHVFLILYKTFNDYITTCSATF